MADRPWWEVVPGRHLVFAEDAEVLTALSRCLVDSFKCARHVLRIWFMGSGVTNHGVPTVCEQRNVPS